MGINFKEDGKIIGGKQFERVFQDGQLCDSDQKSGTPTEGTHKPRRLQTTRGERYPKNPDRTL